ncbi:type III effector protein [Streptomyces sp. LARHCF249]
MSGAGAGLGAGAGGRDHGAGPSSFLAAAAALKAIDEAVRAAQAGTADTAAPPSEHVLDTLMLLRRVRDQLADWESGLIETARDVGASWAELAAPLGVASRQAAERRYLRLRPGGVGATGDERVKATRDRRAANRTVSNWARDNAAELRRLAGEITSLTDLPAGADLPLGELHQALGRDDAGHLVVPLAATLPHLWEAHPDLAGRVQSLTHHTDRLREDSDHRRRTTR